MHISAKRCVWKMWQETAFCQTKCSKTETNGLWNIYLFYQHTRGARGGTTVVSQIKVLKILLFSLFVLHKYNTFVTHSERQEG